MKLSRRQLLRTLCAGAVVAAIPISTKAYETLVKVDSLSSNDMWWDDVTKEWKPCLQVGDTIKFRPFNGWGNSQRAVVEEIWEDATEMFANKKLLPLPKGEYFSVWGRGIWAKRLHSHNSYMIGSENHFELIERRG